MYDLLNDVAYLCKHPEVLLEVQNDLTEKFRGHTKLLYDKLYKNQNAHNLYALPYLLIDGFDDEQVWQQLELHGEQSGPILSLAVAKLLQNQDILIPSCYEGWDDHDISDSPKQSNTNQLGCLDSENNVDIGQSEMLESDVFSDEDNVSQEESCLAQSKCTTKPNVDGTNDAFFKEEDMEKFVNANDNFENSDASLDGGDSDNDDNEEVIKYDDFFNPPAETVSTQENLSTFEKQKAKYKSTIAQLEQKSLQEKPWQLKGEIKADGRPECSLLTEYLDFDQGRREAPAMTEELSNRVESLIIQRIKDSVWDDVEKRILPVEVPAEYKRRIELDSTKPSQSLAQVYEQEYQKALDSKEENNKEREEYTKIKFCMDSLFTKLDALSNLHFMPLMPNPEIKVVKNVPALVLEEVQPTNVSDASLLAPQEVKAKSHREFKGESELSSTDKLRLRRIKKAKQKVFYHHQKALPVASNVKRLKEKKSEEAPKSSASFFKQLQQKIVEEVESKKNSMQKHSLFLPNHNSKMLKLS